MSQHKEYLMFVYGTLKKGFSNNGFLNGAEFLREAKVEGFSMYDLGAFPAVVSSADPNNTITGELWAVPQILIPSINRLEGVPHLYQRVTKKLNGSLDMTMYVMDDASISHWSNAALIPSGEWVKKSNYRLKRVK